VIFLLPVIYGVALLLWPFSPDWKTALDRSALVIASFWAGALLGVIWGIFPMLALVLLLRAVGLEGRSVYIPMLCLWFGVGPVVGTIYAFRSNLEDEHRQRESLER